MSHISLTKLQRGTTTTAIISILSFKIGTKVTTETIDVNGLVDVSFECRLIFESVNSVTAIPFIRMKKNAKVQNAIVQIQVTTKEFNEIFYCSGQWVEAEMKPVGFNSQFEYGNTTSWSYFIEVDITVHELMPVLASPMSQLYKDAEFTDFQLQASDGDVAVHRPLLLAHSDVFNAMMRGEWKEKAENYISIEGVTVQTLQHLKDYMYLGTLPEEGLESLLVVAARYLMDKLKMDCIRKLADSIKPEKITDFIKLACQHNIPELVGAILYRTPDDVMNDFYQLKIKGEEPNDNDKDKNEINPMP